MSSASLLKLWAMLVKIQKTPGGRAGHLQRGQAKDGGREVTLWVRSSKEVPKTRKLRTLNGLVAGGSQ